MVELNHDKMHMKENPHMKTSLSSSSGLVVLILDTNPWFWQNRSSSEFEAFVQSMLLFINSYLLYHRQSQVVVIASHEKTCEVLYSSSGSSSSTKKRKQHFRSIGEQVVQRLKDLSEQVHEAQEITNKKTSGLAQALSKALCVINRAATEDNGLSSRVLIVQGTGDIPAQYISIMNCIFSAQKKAVPVDVCVLSDDHSPYLQQASQLTGGIYTKVGRTKALIQYLFALWLPDQEIRKLIKLPSQDAIDFRAVCFCHKKDISVAFVCPVCLSIFCSFLSICATCGARSHVNPPITSKVTGKRSLNT